jgi:hypothetical protein
MVGMQMREKHLHGVRVGVTLQGAQDPTTEIED